MTSHLDLVIFNRICNLLNGAPMGESTRVHPFTLADYTWQTNKAQEEMLRDMKSRSQDYQSVLTMIPAITKETMRDVLVIPDNAPTRQVMWAEVLSRVDAVDAIVKMGGEVSYNRNASTLHAFAREFRFYRQDKAIMAAIPRDLYEDSWYKMQQIAVMAGKQYITA